MDNQIKIASKETVFLAKPPCCLEFFPNSPDYFVVGTYNLLQSEATSDERSEVINSTSPVKRDGSLEVFKLTSADIIHIDSTAVEYGVLDIHFHGTKLGIATSTGSFEIYSVTKPPPDSRPTLSFVTAVQVASSDTVVTSFAFEPSSNGQRIVMTLSSGAVELLSIPRTQPDTPIPTPDPNRTIFTHSLEAWITACTPPSWGPTPNIFSGGDDALLSFTPIAKTPDITPWTDRRTHQAGVTAILPLPQAQQGHMGKHAIVLTGSYDDKLRVLHVADAARPRRPRVLHEVDLGGGIWRIKLLSLDEAAVPASQRQATDAGTAHVATATLLVSAMYAGAFILRVTFEEGASLRVGESGSSEQGAVEDMLSVGSEIVGHFAEHQSMCYCADAAPVATKTKRRIVSCSFYDRRVCLWEW